jgi:hypothetical protein
MNECKREQRQAIISINIFNDVFSEQKKREMLLGITLIRLLGLMEVHIPIMILIL